LVGDAIGVPYEFSAPDPDRVVGLRGHGTHNQPPGTWSDDGALMLALLDSLTTVGFDPEDQDRRFLAWADSGAYTPDGDGAFDIGGATAAALSRLRAVIPAIVAGGLAGLRWGLDERKGGIPGEWLAALRGRDLIEEILVRSMERAGPSA
jgi:ADP-ribosylglycohydrolase